MRKMTEVEDIAASLDGDALSEWGKRSNVLLIELFEGLYTDYQVDAFFECGAHNAEASRRFMAARPAGIAVAAEANPFTFAKLTSTAQKAGVVAVNVAVGSVAGQGVLHVPRQATDEAPTPGNASLSVRSDHRDSYLAIDVEITTIDELVGRFAPEASLALWIDVEGHALDVLRGARQVLTSGRCRVILVEVEQHQYWHEQPLFEDVDELLRTHGFTRLARDAEYPKQFNVVYVPNTDSVFAQQRLERYHRAVRPHRKIKAKVCVQQFPATLRRRVIRVVGRDRLTRVRSIFFDRSR